MPLSIIYFTYSAPLALVFVSKIAKLCHFRSMDVLGITRAYIKEMVTIAGPQMKVILMDKETVRRSSFFLKFLLLDRHCFMCIYSIGDDAEGGMLVFEFAVEI